MSREKIKIAKKSENLDPLSSPEKQGNRVKRVRNMANLSREQMCEDGEINIHTLVGWENGRFGGLSRSGAVRVVRKLAQEGVHCTVEWLLNEIGAGPFIVADYTKAKLDLQKDNPPELQVDEEETLITHELILFRKQHRDAIDFVVNDDAMVPLYNKGDYVAGIKRYKERIKSIIGLDCIVQTKNGKIMLRNVRNGPASDTYTLVCSNSMTEVSDGVIYDVNLVSAAPVIWHRKKDPR